MKVKELIEKLSQFHPETECYRGDFHGFLNEDMEFVSEVTTRQAHNVYPLDVDYMTVHCHDVRHDRWVEYTGVIFE